MTYFVEMHDASGSILGNPHEQGQWKLLLLLDEQVIERASCTELQHQGKAHGLSLAGLRDCADKVHYVRMVGQLLHHVGLHAQLAQHLLLCLVQLHLVERLHCHCRPMVLSLHTHTPTHPHRYILFNEKGVSLSE